ncbi:MAG: alpha/beta fold hydrolase [Ornithinimicrobium sp.]
MLPGAVRTLAAMVGLLTLSPPMAIAAPVLSSRPVHAVDAVHAAEAASDVERRQVDVGAEPDGTAVSLDVDIYRDDTAANDPSPAVILGHGFGGSKDDLVDQAERLAEEGYVVVAYSARGFGESGGRVHVNDPDFEIADAQVLIDVLADEPGVQQDGEGDPRVGLVGGSYGGAMALMTAGADQRVDAVIAQITWNDLADAFYPQAAVGVDQPGPFKKLWASTFFASVLAAPLNGVAGETPEVAAEEFGAAGEEPEEADVAAEGAGEEANVAAEGAGEEAGGTNEQAGGGDEAEIGGDDGDGPAISGDGDGQSSTAADAQSGAPVDPLCGAFDPDLCQQFRGAMESSEGNEELIEQLRRHSPAPTLSDVTAPTYLVQGMSDSLFGLDQADANARALLDAGVPTAVNWFNGGHGAATAAPAPSADEEGGPPGDDGATVAGEATDLEQEQTDNALTWLDGTLRASEPVTQDTLPLPAFSYVGPAPSNGQAADAYTRDVYPGLGNVDWAAADGEQEASDDRTYLPLSAQGPPALASPPGAVPEALTTIPGVGSLLGEVSTYALAALPGQFVAFDTEPLDEALVVAGQPQVSLDLTSSGQASSLFVSLWEVQPGGPVLPRQLVAPLELDVTPGQSQRVEIALPGGTWDMPAGSTWRVLVSATDGSFRVDPTTRLDQVSLADPALGLSLPVAQATAVSPPSRWDSETVGVAIALGAVLLLAAIAAIRARTRPHPRVDEWTDVPLVVSGLTKAYADGHLAVADVSWRAEKGQVVGLLGPNGAGKTTTLRMVMGLIGQDSGTVHVLGRPVYAGAPVLQRVGALVEGPGFLPHLSGMDNLRAYWAATGRPAHEAQFGEALEIAALGDAVQRPVRSYSHGMRQRLGIAQAMLGMPEVLILDEPTNGLDPPQIAAMRPMLANYAAAGRTVVISSHLLAEVEMTCSHVVVMHAGKVLAAGSVAEVGVEQGRNLEEVFLSTIAGAAGVDSAALNAVRPR